MSELAKLRCLACNSAVRTACSEGDHKSDRKRAAGVRVCAADECNIRCENIELRKRVPETAAGMPVVVPQKTVVLKQQFRCVDLTREY